MTNLKKLYEDYGTYNILYNQLNISSPSVEYAWRRTKKILQDESLRIINLKKNKKNIKVCDIGCGNGALLIRLAESTRKLKEKIEFKGFEISQPFVDYGNQASRYKNLSNLSFHYLDIEKDNLKETFDVIIFSEVLEHVHDPKKLLQKIYKLLNSDGYLLLSTPNSKNLIKYPFLFLKNTVSKKDSQEIAKFLTKKEQVHKLAELEQHLYVFSHGELKKLLKEVGLTVVKAPRGTTLFGGPFLDNHSLLFSLSIVADSLLDILPLSQISWDNIFIAKKK